MERVLKRVTYQKKNSNSSSKPKYSSPIIKRYSVDDNFYTCINKNELYISRNSNNNYYTISNRGDLQRNTVPLSEADSIAEPEPEKQLVREDVTFKKLLKMFNAGESSRGAKEWFSSNASNVMDFAPKILTKRFCGKRNDNELYRSNSFKFERFERTDSDTLTMSKKSPIFRQISLCDDYSVPVDFVNRRPLSLDSGSFWSTESPDSDQVEVLKLYCDPKDSKNHKSNSNETSKQQIEVVEDKVKLYSFVQKQCHHSRTDSSEDGEHEDDETELYENLKHRKLTNQSHSRLANKCNIYTEVRKSPYYYGDLLKRTQSENPPGNRRHVTNSCRKSQSLDGAPVKQEPIYSNDLKYLDRNTSPLQVDKSEKVKEELIEENELDDMATRQRHVYETAFDSKICRPGDVVELDAATNHMNRCSPQLSYHPNFPNLTKDYVCSLERFVNSKKNLNQLESSVDSLSQQFADFDLTERSTLVHGYSSASTSTMPLPLSASSYLNNSADSFSESSHTGLKMPADKFFCGEIIRHKRAKDLNKAVCSRGSKSKKVNDNHNEDDNEDAGRECSNTANVNGFHRRHHHLHLTKMRFSKCHPKNCRQLLKVKEIKSRPKERGSRKFSSTESMTTSSSGGSLESIRSSTSEGNRSTTSTDSHRSSSISSHSSDSAGGSCGTHFSINFPTCNRYLHQNKMHMLSPISDKSFQEPGSESSEMNKNSGSKKSSPAESRAVSPAATFQKMKKRQFTNKHTINSIASSIPCVDFETHQCSDSGISMESRSDASKLTQNNDFSDLPFDMPKLRRRRLQQMQLTQSSAHNISGSATSVDLKELPFDIPKLRRKLRTSAPHDCAEVNVESNSALATLTSVIQPTSGGDVSNASNDSDRGLKRKSLGLSLNLGGVVSTAIDIDSNLPLERQGWYHGTITRMEAENELRNREEGSYLVRNSESAKNEFSLSLKSAKGFMHMRIQKSTDSDKFILGQFSSPFDSIPQMIKYYSSNQLPIRGAEHMCLLQPVIAQLL